MTGVVLGPTGLTPFEYRKRHNQESPVAEGGDLGYGPDAPKAKAKNTVEKGAFSEGGTAQHRGKGAMCEQGPHPRSGRQMETPERL